MENKSSGKKLTKSASGLRMIPLSDTYACPFALSEPEWSSDNAVSFLVNFFGQKALDLECCCLE